MLHHVALLVPDLQRALAGVRALGLEPGPIDEFPAEGTRESYCGQGAARLLLLEAIGPGPYQRALAKRGPGLHHVAVAVEDGPALCAASGWLLHPRTLASQPHTLWLARPGVGALVEVMHDAKPDQGPPVVEGVEVPGLRGLVPGLRASLDDGAWLSIRGRRLAARGGLEALA